MQIHATKVNNSEEVLFLAVVNEPVPVTTNTNIKVPVDLLNSGYIPVLWYLLKYIWCTYWFFFMYWKIEKKTLVYEFYLQI